MVNPRQASDVASVVIFPSPFQPESPLTSSLVAGLVVPMPTFPLLGKVFVCATVVLASNISVTSATPVTNKCFENVFMLIPLLFGLLQTQQHQNLSRTFLHRFERFANQRARHMHLS